MDHRPRTRRLSTDRGLTTPTDNLTRALPGGPTTRHCGIYHRRTLTKTHRFWIGNLRTPTITLAVNPRFVSLAVRGCGIHSMSYIRKKGAEHSRKAGSVHYHWCWPRWYWVPHSRYLGAGRVQYSFRIQPTPGR